MPAALRLPLLAALLVLPSAPASAQLGVYVEAGAAIPTRTFADVANAGPRFAAGIARGADTPGPAFGADVGYARATHTSGDANSELIGLTAWVGYSMRADFLTVLPHVGVGALSHARQSDDFPGLDSSRAGVAARVGLRLVVPVGRLRVFAAGSWEKGLGSLGTPAFPTELRTVGAGVTLPLGP